jgi:hypothetical protein
MYITKIYINCQYLFLFHNFIKLVIQHYRIRRGNMSTCAFPKYVDDGLALKNKSGYYKPEILSFIIFSLHLDMHANKTS